MQLQLKYRVDLYPRESLIVFDEVQLCPKARQSIKTLVKDHRYDYIETGSLISIKKNVKVEDIFSGIPTISDGTGTASSPEYQWKDKNTGKRLCSADRKAYL